MLKRVDEGVNRDSAFGVGYPFHSNAAHFGHGLVPWALSYRQITFCERVLQVIFLKKILLLKMKSGCCLHYCS